MQRTPAPAGVMHGSGSKSRSKTSEKEDIMNIIDFDSYLEKWEYAHRKRYRSIKLKTGYHIYDNIKFDVVKNGPVIEEERDALKEVRKRNREWAVRLKRIIEKRKQDPEIWKPILDIEHLD